MKHLSATSRRTSKIRGQIQYLPFILVCLFLWAAPSAAEDKAELVVSDGHRGEVRGVAVTPVTQRVLSCAVDGSAKLWDPARERVLLTYHDPEALKRGAYQPYVNSVECDARESVVLTGCDDRMVRLYDLESGHFLRRWKISGKEDFPRRDDTFARFSGDRVVTVDGDKTLAIWNLNGKALGQVNLPFRAEKLATSATHAAVYYGNEAVIVDLKSKQVGAKITTERDMSDIRFSHDGKQLLLAAWDAHVYDLNGKKLGQKPVGAHTVVADFGKGDLVAASPNPEFTTTAYLGTKTEVFPKEVSPVVCLDADGAGRTVVGTMNGEVFFRDNSQPYKTLDHRATLISAVDTDQTGRYIVTGSRQGNVKVWDLKTGRPGPILKGLRAYVGVVRMSANTRYIAAGDQYYGEVVVWERATGEVVSTYKLKEYRATFGSGVSSMAFSPKGDILAIGRSDKNEIIMLDTLSGRVRFKMDLDSRGGIHALAFNNAGDRVAAAVPMGSARDLVVEWHPESRAILHRRETVARAKISDLDYSDDDRKLVACGRSGQIWVWDTQFEDEGKVQRIGLPVHAALFAPDGQIIAGAEGGKLYFINTSDWSQREFQAHNSPVGDVRLVSNGRIVLTASADRDIRIWDRHSGEFHGSVFELDHGKDWLVVSPHGRFDASGQGHQILDLKIGDRLYNLEQFFTKYYTPGLLRELAPTDGKARVAVGPSASEVAINKPPEVRIVSPRSGDPVDNPETVVKVEVKDQGGGVQDVSLYHNGHRVPDSRRRQVGASAFEYPVKLVAGVNELRASAHNSDRSIQSRPHRVRVRCDAKQARQPQLFVLAVGVDEYESGLKLGFAKADAQAIAKAFKPGLFDKVVPKVVINSEATRAGVLKSLAELETLTEPQDALILYVAGHGTVQGDLYYFLPFDAKIQTEDEVKRTGISSVELADRLSRIPATKQLLVLDTCRSGAAAGVLGKYLATRGGLEEMRSQQLLARTAGTFLLAASTSDQYAYELPELGHGVLTYSILKALDQSGAGKVTVNGLLQSVSAEVPALTERYHGDRQEVVQYSSGQDFPLTSPQ